MNLKPNKLKVLYLGQYFVIFTIINICLFIIGGLVGKMNNFSYLEIFVLILIWLLLFIEFLYPALKMYQNDKNKNVIVKDDMITILENNVISLKYNIQEVKKVNIFKPGTIKLNGFYSIEQVFERKRAFTMTSIMFKNQEEFDKFVNMFESSIVDTKFVKLIQMYE